MRIAMAGLTVLLARASCSDRAHPVTTSAAEGFLVWVEAEKPPTTRRGDRPELAP